MLIDSESFQSTNIENQLTLFLSNENAMYVQLKDYSMVDNIVCHG
jgi:hypothetical protein